MVIIIICILFSIYEAALKLYALSKFLYKIIINRIKLQILQAFNFILILL